MSDGNVRNTIKKLGGRPPELTDELRDELIDALSDGVPYEMAAHAQGISERVLYNWLARGKLELRDNIESIYTKFVQLLKKVEQKKMRDHLQQIKMKPERWQADAWLLERRWWKQFSANAAVLDFEERLQKMERDHHGEINETESEEEKGDT